MNICKKIFLRIEQKCLGFKYVMSANWYQRAMHKYLTHLGVKDEGAKFVARDVKIDTTDPTLVTIGKGSVVTSKVTILVHDYSIEVGLTAIGKQDPVYESMFLRPVKIGANCFIGQNSFLKPGTEIGDNCIIGAGSVVGGKIPSGSIYAGNPATFYGKIEEWAEKKVLEHRYRNGSVRRKST